MKFEERFEKLNDEQRLAVETVFGPVLVIAGPGSGKTELLSMRVANILRETDALPASVLCLTFTDNAAVNMRNRLSALIGQDAFKISIHTFHSFGTEIINHNPEFFYKGAIFNPADELLQREIIEEILENMGFKSKLKYFHPEQGYTFLNTILNKINDLKNAGLSPEEFNNIIQNNKIFLEAVNPMVAQVFSQTISKKNFATYSSLIVEMQNILCPWEHDSYESLKELYTESLKKAVNSAISDESTKPMTGWKKDFTDLDWKKERVLKDMKRVDLHEELGQVYQKYQNELYKRGYFDYSDMILDTVRAMEENPELKYNLQEKYQFVLVDEFQDTSGVQMRLLNNLLDAEVNEGRPNVLAVGDDDQAIYKFQGAKLANIMNFNKKWEDVKLIVLNKNYRSNQKVLDLVREIILKGDDRLENQIQEIKKELIAENPNIPDGKIEVKEFTTFEGELKWIAKTIKNENYKFKETAIITRKHKDLEMCAKVLDYFGMPVKYERKKDILEQKEIKEIFTILKFLETGSDLYMPEILNFTFWGIPRLKSWEVSVKAFKEEKKWLEIMLEDEELKGLAKFLIELSGLKYEKTAEELIDYITGVSEINGFKCPYKDFYFKDGFNIEFLSGLQALVQAVRKHKGSKAIDIKNLLDFLELHEKHNIKIYNTSKLNEGENAISLLTAHGAKGLEFENVFIFNCRDEVWMKGSSRNLIPLPGNLPVSAEKDNNDDNLRLFYVALSRAKSNIFISYSKIENTGKEKPRLRFLEGLEEMKHEEIGDEIKKLFELKYEIQRHKFKEPDEKNFLKSLTENYMLSVTHLNNFLDIANAGPLTFLQDNLLRFPQMPTKSNSYGSAIHGALDQFQKQFKKTKTMPGLSEFLEMYTNSLKQRRLNKKDFEELLGKGLEHLTIYYNQNQDRFNYRDESEFNFRSEGVRIGDAGITGKIDKMQLNKESGEAVVIDFKTGKPLDKWETSDAFGKIKAWKFKNQLVFYKLLVEKSGSFNGRLKVNRGIMEFIEPNQDHKASMLALEISEEDCKKLKAIIEVVYTRIVNLDFPDVSQYDKSMKGILEFIEDLL